MRRSQILVELFVIIGQIFFGDFFLCLRNRAFQICNRSRRRNFFLGGFLQGGFIFPDTLLALFDSPLTIGERVGFLLPLVVIFFRRDCFGNFDEIFQRFFLRRNSFGDSRDGFFLLRAFSCPAIEFIFCGTKFGDSRNCLGDDCGVFARTENGARLAIFEFGHQVRRAVDDLQTIQLNLRGL